MREKWRGKSLLPLSELRLDWGFNMVTVLTSQRGTTFSNRRLHSADYIKTPSHSRGGEEKHGGFRKKFFTGPPSSVKVFSSPSLHSLSFHCRSLWLPHLVVVSVSPHRSSLPPSSSVCPSPSFLPPLLPGTFQSGVLHALLSILSPQPLNRRGYPMASGLLSFFETRCVCLLIESSLFHLPEVCSQRPTVMTGTVAE